MLTCFSSVDSLNSLTMVDFLKIVIFTSFLIWGICIVNCIDIQGLVLGKRVVYKSFAHPERKRLRPTEKLRQILASKYL